MHSIGLWDMEYQSPFRREITPRKRVNTLGKKKKKNIKKKQSKKDASPFAFIMKVNRKAVDTKKILKIIKKTPQP